jgi:hypothetical protein
MLSDSSERQADEDDEEDEDGFAEADAEWAAVGTSVGSEASARLRAVAAAPVAAGRIDCSAGAWAAAETGAAVAEEAADEADETVVVVALALAPECCVSQIACALLGNCDGSGDCVCDESAAPNAVAHAAVTASLANANRKRAYRRTM